MTWKDWYNSLKKPSWTPETATTGELDSCGMLWWRRLCIA